MADATEFWPFITALASTVATAGAWWAAVKSYECASKANALAQRAAAREQRESEVYDRAIAYSVVIAIDDLAGSLLRAAAVIPYHLPISHDELSSTARDVGGELRKSLDRDAVFRLGHKSVAAIRHAVQLCEEIPRALCAFDMPGDGNLDPADYLINASRKLRESADVVWNDHIHDERQSLAEFESTTRAAATLFFTKLDEVKTEFTRGLREAVSELRKLDPPAN